MQCKNCGATIHEGDTFCRTCAVPIDINPYSGLEDVNNPATNMFMRRDSRAPKQSEPVYKNENFQNIKPPQNPTVDEDANKKFVERDGNDRATATLKNVLGLAILIIIILIIGFWLYDKVFSNF